GLPEVFAGMVAGGEHDVLEHRHATELLRDLERPRQALVVDAVRRPAGDVEPVEGDAAAIWTDGSRDAVEAGGLAGAVGGDQAGDKASFDLDRCAVYGPVTTEPLLQAVDHEDRVSHSLPVRLHRSGRV